MPIKLKCPHCGKVWLYKGDHKIYVTCSDCKRNVRIADNTIITDGMEKETEVINNNVLLDVKENGWKHIEASNENQTFDLRKGK
jgi:DNA-directed RNA polymerase subunit RPC12/RpoP